MFITFLTIIAWIVGPLASATLFIRLYLDFQYFESLQQKLDQLRGIKKTFPLFWPFILMIISWAWIAAKFLS